MLIKVVKLLGSLVTEEPRYFFLFILIEFFFTKKGIKKLLSVRSLARKLLEPLVTIIQNTGAKSLQYECIYTVTEGCSLRHAVVLKVYLLTLSSSAASFATRGRF